MLLFCVVVLCSFALSFVLTPLCRNAALRLGLVDRPDHRRKLHQCPVPRVGGVPILLAYAGALGLALLAQEAAGRPLLGKAPAAAAGPALSPVLYLLPALLVVFLTGLVDDIRGLRPSSKLLGQLIAAALVIWAGVRIEGVGVFTLGPWLGIPITFLWLVGCANAFNLIDGLDGLATGVALFACLTTLVAAVLQENVSLILATAPLAGALFGFIRYNFNPASIFLGDSGSLTLGFLLGCYAIIWSQKSATALGMTAPLMALAIPLLDTALAILRRFLRGQPIFSADRGHIHHRLLDRGLTPRRAALLMYGVCGLAATFSLLQSLAGRQYRGLIIVLFCAAAWVGIQHLGYIEFHAAARLATPRTFQRVLSAQLRLRSLEDSLAHAASLEDCWGAVRDASADFGLTFVRMHLDQGSFQHAVNGAANGQVWTLHVPLSRDEFVELGRDFHTPAEPILVAPLADLLRRTLAPKVALLQAAALADESPAGFQPRLTAFQACAQAQPGSHAHWRPHHYQYSTGTNHDLPPCTTADGPV